MNPRRTVHPRSVRALAACAALVAAACSDAATAPRGPVPPKGVVVLNGSAVTGVTVVDTAGASSAHIDFDDSFDGGGFVVERDSVLSTSSAFGGDKLWVADLGAGTAKSFQMPAGSDPSNANFLHGVGGAAFGVTLRATGALVLVSLPSSGTGVLDVIANAARCPTDVFAYSNNFWVVDANADCANFAADGVARLIRFAVDGSPVDTLALAAGAISTSASAVVSEGFAYVATGGDADFSGYPAPPTFVRPGVVTKVDLSARQVVGSIALPAGTYGATMHLGADGRLYVAAYHDNTFARQDVYAIDPASMSFTGPRASGKSYLDLRSSSDAPLSVGATTADALGRIYSVVVDYASAGASKVYVFDATGKFLRALPAGQYAVDVALR
ncbi:MAG TPA: hypothetical protein VFJ74_01575 [Gemmatimonadaceae bacterium]|nr:hypothetical protein [Gemmatimonadaceae bacterium]